MPELFSAFHNLLVACVPCHTSKSSLNCHQGHNKTELAVFLHGTRWEAPGEIRDLHPPDQQRCLHPSKPMMSVETVWKERSSFKVASVMIVSCLFPLETSIYVFINHSTQEENTISLCMSMGHTTEQDRATWVTKKPKLKPNKRNPKAVFKSGNELQLEKERSQRTGNHTILYNSWMDHRMSQEKNFRIYVTECRWKQNTLNVQDAADLWPEGHPQHRTRIQPKKERCKSTPWDPLEFGEENEVTERREETVKTADVNGLWNGETVKEINETKSWWSRKVNEVSQAFSRLIKREITKHQCQQ